MGLSLNKKTCEEGLIMSNPVVSIPCIEGATYKTRKPCLNCTLFNRKTLCIDLTLALEQCGDCLPGFTDDGCPMFSDTFKNPCRYVGPVANNAEPGMNYCSLVTIVLFIICAGQGIIIAHLCTRRYLVSRRPSQTASSDCVDKSDTNMPLEKKSDEKIPQTSAKEDPMDYGSHNRASEQQENGEDGKPGRRSQTSGPDSLHLTDIPVSHMRDIMSHNKLYSHVSGTSGYHSHSFSLPQGPYTNKATQSQSGPAMPDQSDEASDYRKQHQHHPAKCQSNCPHHHASGIQGSCEGHISYQGPGQQSYYQCAFYYIDTIKYDGPISFNYQFPSSKEMNRNTTDEGTIPKSPGTRTVIAQETETGNFSSSIQAGLTPIDETKRLDKYPIQVTEQD